MSTGKFSPLFSEKNLDFNMYGEAPANEFEIDAFDDEGFDYYGYSCFDTEGKYVGIGQGIDRYGFTEDDYLNDAARGGTLYEDALNNCYPVRIGFYREQRRNKLYIFERNLK